MFIFRKLLIFYRVIANILVLIVLASSAYAITLTVERSKDFEKKKERGEEVSWWETNEVCFLLKCNVIAFRLLHCYMNRENKIVFLQVTIVMSLITALFPTIFDIIGLMEKYHPRINLRFQLGR